MSKLNQTNLLSFFAKPSNNNVSKNGSNQNGNRSSGSENDDDEEEVCELKTSKRQRLKILDSDDEIESQIVGSSKKVRISNDDDDKIEIADTATPKKRKLKQETSVIIFILISKTFAQCTSILG